MSMITPTLFLRFAILLLSIAPNPSSGFAAWLKCNRYLEEDEVIMNNKVRNAPQAEDGEPIVKLSVYDSSGSRVDVPSEEVNGESIVWIDPSLSSLILSFEIRMDPESVSKLHDLQYVVETAPFDESEIEGSSAPAGPSYPDRPSPTPQSPSLPSPSAPAPAAPAPVSPVPAGQKIDIAKYSSFVEASTGGGIICNGRRGHSRGKNGYVKYQLVTKKNGDDGDSVESDDGILSEIVGGWSESHGPVTLTPRIIFKKRVESKDEL